MLTAGLLYQLILIISCFHICSTLFYTNSRENDYPRIGKRLEMFEVLKGKFSSPKYKETYNTESPVNARFKDIDSNKQTWDLGKNKHSFFGESKLERQLDQTQPIVIAVQHKYEKRRSHTTEEDSDIDDFLEMFQGINPEFDNML